MTIDQTPITKAELFKIYLNIDRQLLNEAFQYNTSLNGLGATEIQAVNTAIDEILNTDLSETAIYALAFDAQEQLGSWFSNAWDKVKSAGKKVVSAVSSTVKKAASAVHRVVTAPARGLVTLALKLFSGKVAGAFIYIFIPDNSSYLKNNRELARKTARAKGFISKLKKGAAFQDGYLEKHIRNAVVKEYKKSPELVIKELSKGNGLNGGLGAITIAGIAALSAAIVPVLAVVPSIVGAFKPSSDIPENSDFPAPIPPQSNVTNDPAAPGYKPAPKPSSPYSGGSSSGGSYSGGSTPNYSGGSSSPSYSGGGNYPPVNPPFYQTPLGMAAIGGGVLAVGGVIYLATKK
jgi:hypothetical protein